jgi:hypothetical protein
MKKIFILVITALVGSLNAFSQINVGASMGVNFSYLIGDDRIEDATKRIGMCPGIHVAFPLVYESFLEVSAIYSQQGVMIKKDYQERNFHIKYRENRNIDFMIIPITWKQQFGDFYTKVGPYVGIALAAERSWKCDSISPDSAKRISGKEASFVNDLRQYDVGANFGLGYQTSISGGIDLFVGVDYRIGFFSIEDKNKKQINNKKLRNQVFSFSAGIYFVKNRRSKTYRHHR